MKMLKHKAIISYMSGLGDRYGWMPTDGDTRIKFINGFDEYIINYKNEFFMWIKNGKIHRENGPAVIEPKLHRKEYWIKDYFMTKHKFKQWKANEHKARNY